MPIINYPWTMPFDNKKKPNVIDTKLYLYEIDKSINEKTTLLKTFATAHRVKKLSKLVARQKIISKKKRKMIITADKTRNKRKKIIIAT